jgi:hypothetical protein
VGLRSWETRARLKSTRYCFDQLHNTRGRHCKDVSGWAFRRLAVACPPILERFPTNLKSQLCHVSTSVVRALEPKAREWLGVFSPTCMCQCKSR